jgi:hypothetical protein
MMDQPEIARIRSLLLEATDAIDRARLISAALDVDDRAMLATSLDEISSALHFLQKLYLRHPGLAEEGARWHGLAM